MDSESRVQRPSDGVTGEAAVKRRGLYIGLTIGVCLLLGVGLILYRGIEFRGPAEISSALQLTDGRLRVLVSTCGGDPILEQVDETNTQVRLTVVSTQRRFGGGGASCLDLVEVTLQEPLGNRTLFDTTSGKTLSVSR